MIIVIPKEIVSYNNIRAGDLLKIPDQIEVVKRNVKGRKQYGRQQKSQKARTNNGKP